MTQPSQLRLSSGTVINLGLIIGGLILIVLLLVMRLLPGDEGSQSTGSAVELHQSTEGFDSPGLAFYPASRRTAASSWLTHTGMTAPRSSASSPCLRAGPRSQRNDSCSSSPSPTPRTVLGQSDPKLGQVQAFGEDDAGQFHLLTDDGFVFHIAATDDPA